MIFDLFYKIRNRLHKPTNINLFKLNENNLKYLNYEIEETYR